jgi:hypothetical protein
MKQQIVAVPNPINDALDAVERLGRLHLLDAMSCELLSADVTWWRYYHVALLYETDGN